jgi:hypothetical protein
MSEASSKDTHHYEIEICGQLSGRRARMFEGWQVALTSDGHTTISGEEIDQSALFGILIRIRDLGIPLLSVKRTDLETEYRGAEK